MKISTLIGVVLSTASLIGMSAVGSSAYIKEVERVELVEYQRQHKCLALNIYHEAKGESELGQRAVAYVTMNRVQDPAYPDDVCSVVQQGIKRNGIPVQHKCQFSWYCDGKSDIPTDSEAYAEAEFVAAVVLNNYGMSFDPTLGATMYHADYVKPSWRKSFEKTTEIENHIFYRKE